MKCSECDGNGYVDRGPDTDECLACQPDLMAIRSVVAASSDAGLTVDNKEYRRQFKLLLKRYEEVVEAMSPAQWQTPLSRALELRDNLVITGQIKELVSRS